MELYFLLTECSHETFFRRQSIDLHDVTVILGANIVEVLSTQPEVNLTNHDNEQSAAVKRYACRCTTCK